MYKEVVIMTGNDSNVNKFIPKIPETRTEIVLNQEQQKLQEQTEQKSATEKVIETVKEAPKAIKEEVVPTIHASGSKDGRGSPKIVQRDKETHREAMDLQRQRAEAQKRTLMEDASNTPQCEVL
jgi:hypothetical protein